MLGFFVVGWAPVAEAQVQTTSYFGGGDVDEIRAAAIGADGAIYVAGTSASAEIAGSAGTRLSDGNGFVARLAPAADAIDWLARTANVKDMVVGPDGHLLLLHDSHIAALTTDGKSFAWEGPDVGATEAFSVGAHGKIAVLAGDAFLFDSGGQTELWSKDVGRSHPAAIAIDPVTGDVFVSGDTNTNTGHEPWRSPFLFRYAAADGERTLELYDWPGPAVRENDRMLQADSFVTHLAFMPDGELWIGAGSDGGNTVLRQEPDDLDTAQDALEGACFDGPCFGYKGAKKTGMFARMKPELTDMDRASWVIPYVGMPPGTVQDPPCGCKGGDFQGGDGVNPGSFAVQDIVPVQDEVVLLGNPWGDAPVTTDTAWYPQAVYGGGGIGWMAIFSEDLSSIRQGSMLPGTKSAYGTYRGGRLVVVGKAQSSDPPSDPAEEGWLTNLPTDGTSLQADFGGGDTDGYLIVACMTTEEECTAPPSETEDPSEVTGTGDGTTSDGTTGDASSTGSGGAMASAGTGGAGVAADPEGCGCRVAGSSRGSTAGLWLGLGLFGLWWRRRMVVAH